LRKFHQRRAFDFPFPQGTILIPPPPPPPALPNSVLRALMSPDKHAAAIRRCANSRGD
jgi:hypothetical protein